MEFCNHDPAEYNRLMELADKYDLEAQKFEEYMCEMEEESITFEKQQK